MSTCLNRATLNRFVLGTLPDADASTTAEHLEACRRCAEALDMLPLDRDLLESVIDAWRARENRKEYLARLEQLEARVTTAIALRA